MSLARNPASRFDLQGVQSPAGQSDCGEERGGHLHLDERGIKNWRMAKMFSVVYTVRHGEGFLGRKSGERDSHRVIPRSQPASWPAFQKGSWLSLMTFSVLHRTCCESELSQFLIPFE